MKLDPVAILTARQHDIRRGIVRHPSAAQKGEVCGMKPDPVSRIKCHRTDGHRGPHRNGKAEW